MKLCDLFEASSSSPVKKELDEVNAQLAGIKQQQHSLWWQAEKLARKDAANDGIDLKNNVYNSRWLERENREKRPNAFKLSTVGVRGAEASNLYFTNEDLLEKARAAISEIRKLSKQRRELMKKKHELANQYRKEKVASTPKPRGLSGEHVDKDTLENIKQTFEYILDRYQDYFIEIYPELKNHSAYRSGYVHHVVPRFFDKRSEIMKAFGYRHLPKLEHLHLYGAYAKPYSQEEHKIKELLDPLKDMVTKARQLARQYVYIRDKLSGIITK